MCASHRPVRRYWLTPMYVDDFDRGPDRRLPLAARAAGPAADLFGLPGGPFAFPLGPLSVFARFSGFAAFAASAAARRALRGPVVFGDGG